VTVPSLVDDLDSGRSLLRRTPIWLIVLVFGSLFIGQQVVSGGTNLRITIAAVAMFVLVIPALQRPRGALVALFIVLPFLGLIRRLFVPSTGVASLDPLLLLTSAVALTILVSLLMSGELDFEGTTTSRVIFLLLLVGLLQVFNPGQGSLLVGLTGIMINLIPISFFFIARSISDQQMTAKIVKIVSVVGGLAALYGLKQVFFGFASFDRLGDKAYTAATVGETTRPLSFFNNASEYASYAHIAFVLVFAALLFRSEGSRRHWPLVMAAVLAYGGFLIGSRGFTVKIVFAVIVLMAARARNRVLAAGVVVLLSSLAIGWTVVSTSDSTIQEKEAGASQLVEQQLRALKDPFDRTKSTLPIHFESAYEGVFNAITKFPAGLGTGVATRGGAKFQGGIQAGAEFDVADGFLSLGIPGGLLYMAAIFFGVRGASRVRRAMPGPVWIGIYAVTLTSVGAWLVGGNYSITPLIWFLLGASDGMYKRLQARNLLEDTVLPERSTGMPIASRV
jgi:hypothetical protein